MSNKRQAREKKDDKIPVTVLTGFLGSGKTVSGPRGRLCVCQPMQSQNDR